MFYYIRFDICYALLSLLKRFIVASPGGLILARMQGEKKQAGIRRNVGAYILPNIRK